MYVCMYVYVYIYIYILTQCEKPTVIQRMAVPTIYYNVI